ncbi:hypothetical protein BJ165DRAFT_1344476 [Panaeolus papilionaceus]|nr:hypothetical protein BJ165DRAFT_1344476 [Panaeolus papilionaceus]
MPPITTKILGYRALPVSIFAFITYLAIFVALSVTDTLEDVPKKNKWGGLDVKEAGEDLRVITSHPHPYNSHANDAVRSYLLSRLKTIAANYSHVHIIDDMKSSAVWVNNGAGVYFEGTNVLVKVDGLGAGADGNENNNADVMHEEKDAILFSAHYDSVSTAPGATDDGMGVATLLQLVKYFAQHRGKRSAIFNVNNGEEDWLNGAHAFMEHPWSNLTDTFLNLEGAAAGGRPILFRATSTTPVRAFKSDLIPHPHANVLSADAFARGAIKSGTDYSVYVDAGMQGLDLAFYKGRSRYHTKYDSVAYTLGGEKSLWSMMEVARGVGVGLVGRPANTKKVETKAMGEKVGDAPVYFDLFKSLLVVFPLSNLLIYNVVALIVGPILLIFFIVAERVILHRRESDDASSSSSDSDEEDEGTRRGNRRKMGGWGARLWVCCKFWVALVASGGVLAGWVWMWVVGNPFAIYSSPYLILLSALSLTYLVQTYILAIPHSFPFFSPSPSSSWKHHLTPHQQSKHITLHALYIFTWLLLLLSTLGITQLHPGIASGYLMSTWNTVVGLACVMGAVESGVAVARGRKDEESDSDSEEEDEDGEDGVYDELEGNGRARRGAHAPAAHDERAPLLRNDSAPPLPGPMGKEREGIDSIWWLPQFLVSVPLPVVLFGNVAMLVLDGMSQGVVDGGWVGGVYILTALISLLLLLPLSPFATKLYACRPLTYLAIGLFVLSTLTALLSFPFTVEDPLKVFFQQKIELSAGVVKERIVGVMPSAQHELRKGEKARVRCVEDEVKKGLERCEWRVGVHMGLDVEYFEAEVVRTGPSNATFRVRGRNTRNCRVYFEGAVFWFGVRQGPDEMQRGYPIPPQGIKEIRLWGREWEKEWVVDVDWGYQIVSSAPEMDTKMISGMKGRIACEWVEYESGMVDTGKNAHPKIPAFEEVLSFLPEWAAVSKYADGLVEVWAPFEI